MAGEQLQSITLGRIGQSWLCKSQLNSISRLQRIFVLALKNSLKDGSPQKSSKTAFNHLKSARQEAGDLVVFPDGMTCTWDVSKAEEVGLKGVSYAF